MDSQRRNEIEDIVDQLETTWKHHPDFRLGQLIINAMLQRKDDTSVFHIKDETLFQFLKQLETDGIPSTDRGTD